jgi:ABC-2 type transport system permease protein
MYFLWPGVLAAVLQQVLLLGLALALRQNSKMAALKISSKCPSLLKLMSVKIIPYLIMSFGLWIMYWLFTLWFRIPFYDNLPRLWQEYS